jgi:hypothetical protein
MKLGNHVGHIEQVDLFPNPETENTLAENKWKSKFTVDAWLPSEI